MKSYIIFCAVFASFGIVVEAYVADFGGLRAAGGSQGGDRTDERNSTSVDALRAAQISAGIIQQKDEGFNAAVGARLDEGAGGVTGRIIDAVDIKGIEATVTATINSGNAFHSTAAGSGAEGGSAFVGGNAGGSAVANNVKNGLVSNNYYAAGTQIANGDGTEISQGLVGQIGSTEVLNGGSAGLSAISSGIINTNNDAGTKVELSVQNESQSREPGFAKADSPQVSNRGNAELSEVNGGTKLEFGASSSSESGLGLGHIDTTRLLNESLKLVDGLYSTLTAANSGTNTNGTALATKEENAEELNVGNEELSATTVGGDVGNENGSAQGDSPVVRFDTTTVLETDAINSVGLPSTSSELETSKGLALSAGAISQSGFIADTAQETTAGGEGNASLGQEHDGIFVSAPVGQTDAVAYGQSNAGEESTGQIGGGAEISTQSDVGQVPVLASGAAELEGNVALAQGPDGRIEVTSGDGEAAVSYREPSAGVAPNGQIAGGSEISTQNDEQQVSVSEFDVVPSEAPAGGFDIEADVVSNGEQNVSVGENFEIDAGHEQVGIYGQVALETDAANIGGVNGETSGVLNEAINEEPGAYNDPSRDANIEHSLGSDAGFHSEAGAERGAEFVTSVASNGGFVTENNSQQGGIVISTESNSGPGAQFGTSVDDEKISNGPIQGVEVITYEEVDTRNTGADNEVNSAISNGNSGQRTEYIQLPNTGSAADFHGATNPTVYNVHSPGDYYSYRNNGHGSGRYRTGVTTVFSRYTPFGGFGGFNGYVPGGYFPGSFGPGGFRAGSFFG